MLDDNSERSAKFWGRIVKQKIFIEDWGQNRKMCIWTKLRELKTQRLSWQEKCTQGNGMGYEKAAAKTDEICCWIYIVVTILIIIGYYV